MLAFTPPPVEGETLMNFGKALQGNAAEQGDKPAVICDGETLTWRAFGEQLGRVAGALRAEGVRPGDTVASLAENSLDHVVLYCAAVWAGACIVPLPFSATKEALCGMMADSGSALLFASPTQLETASQIGAKRVFDLSALRDMAAKATPQLPADVAPTDLFNIIYSSGTTGVPKGILHDHRFRSRQLSRMSRFGFAPSNTMVISTPIYSNTTLFAMLPTLSFGGTLIVMSKFNTVQFLELSERLRPTHAVLVPVQYMRLMAEQRFGDFDLSSYLCKFSTSAPLPGSLISQVMERWPGNLIEVYGMTEGGISTALNCAEHPDKWDTVGLPGEGVDMRVIDDEGVELAAGAYGELVGRAPSMSQGYNNLPAQTEALLWHDASGAAFIRSGDMGRVDEDGFVHLLDRKKDMIISGGFNIYAADLEAALRQHPDVADTAVIAVPSEQWGETPLGFVVLAKGARASAAEILSATNAKLGKTQRLSQIVLRDDLPRSEIGKVLKKDLRDPYWPER